MFTRCFSAAGRVLRSVPLRRQSARRLLAARASSGDMFGDAEEFGSADADEGPLSRTASKKRAHELLQLGRELTSLQPRALERLRLPPDLAEVVAEHARIQGKRGTGSVKKGRARVEALLGQILRSYPAERAARVAAAVTNAAQGLPFQPIEAAPVGSGGADHAAAEARARDWLRGLLSGDAEVSTEVFSALGEAAEGEGVPDRVALRQLLSKAVAEAEKQTEARATAAAIAAAAAAAAAAELPEGTVLLSPPVGRPSAAAPLTPAGKELLWALQALALASG